MGDCGDFTGKDYSPRTGVLLSKWDNELREPVELTEEELKQKEWEEEWDRRHGRAGVVPG